MPPVDHGPRFLSGAVELSVFAPFARSLVLRLDGAELPMRRDGSGFFRRLVEGVGDGARYAFAFEDGRVRPDPATRRQPDGVHAPSQLFDPRRHAWGDAGWRGHKLEDLVFYELHVGTFTPEGTLDAAIARLPDLVQFGITCVELMPVQPFPGARNWGYDGVAPFGVHEAYGGPAALQRFVDAAHGLGLSVCLDVVYNHLGPEGSYLRELGPYFSPRHQSPWGDALNFDGEGAGPVRRFMIEAAVQWIRDFHADALRLDAVHAIQDDSPVHLVAELAREVLAEGRREGRAAHVVAESDLNDRRIVEPPPGGWGVSTVWADDLHHAIHALVTGERESFYQDYGAPEHVARALAEGFVYQGQRSAYRRRPHGTSPRGLAPSRFIVCAQNHDQVGNRPRGERLSVLVPEPALHAVAALVALGSGLPLIFMGEEYGETRPFLYFTSHGDPDLARAVTLGRKREHVARGQGPAPDPQSEQTFFDSKLSHRRDGPHGRLRETWRALLAARRRHLEDISAGFPEVRAEGRAFDLRRPGLAVEVNLGPAPALGLPAWGYRVRES